MVSRPHCFQNVAAALHLPSPHPKMYMHGWLRNSGTLQITHSDCQASFVWKEKRCDKCKHLRMGPAARPDAMSNLIKADTAFLCHQSSGSSLQLSQPPFFCHDIFFHSDSLGTPCLISRKLPTIIFYFHPCFLFGARLQDSDTDPIR